MTWGPDDRLYTSWGDGGGFGGTNNDGRVSLGFARIEGPPESFRAVNVWGGKDAENPAQFEGKSAGLISVNGVLYALINLQNRSWPYPDHTLAWSENMGATWERASWIFPGRKGAFRPETFLNFGRDNANAPDEYVYVYGRTIGSQETIHLARVPERNVRDKSAYMYFSGLDKQGIPLWSPKIEERQPCFTDRNGVNIFSVVYNHFLGRYIATTAHGNVAHLGVFDAAEPWGPWTTIAYYDRWSGYENRNGHALIYSIPVKWISDDGLTMWMIFSAYDPPARALDSFNVIKCTLYSAE